MSKLTINTDSWWFLVPLLIIASLPVAGLVVAMFKYDKAMGSFLMAILISVFIVAAIQTYRERL